MTSPEDIAQRINWVIQETPYEKVTPELWTRIQAGVVRVGDFYDDETLVKVRKVISDYITNEHDVMDEQDVTDLIGALQNAGILFRERIPD